MGFMLGIERLIQDESAMSWLKKARVGLVAHPASVDDRCEHTIDRLMSHSVNIVRAFGPQHGMRGDKQDNMIESEDYRDQLHDIDVISLYGKLRFPSEEMLADLDIVIFDLQDVGCRIYTYITTLYYFIQACDQYGIELWVLDRPNPAGRPIDGTFLVEGNESFVGCAPIPTRHGLTTGELTGWFKEHLDSETKIRIFEMDGYRPNHQPGFGWPVPDLPWINPSPNAASLNMTRCFSGTVLLEGTIWSEGRGTAIPLEVLGAPRLPIHEMIELLGADAAHWLEGIKLRPCFFSPTSNKHQGQLCSGAQIHTDVRTYDHFRFKPYRLVAGLMKAYKLIRPKENLWRHHEYEYEKDRIPIDVIDGSSRLRNWVDDPNYKFTDLEEILVEDEARWEREREKFLFYK